MSPSAPRDLLSVCRHWPKRIGLGGQLEAGQGRGGAGGVAAVQGQGQKYKWGRFLELPEAGHTSSHPLHAGVRPGLPGTSRCACVSWEMQGGCWGGVLSAQEGGHTRSRLGSAPPRLLGSRSGLVFTAAKPLGSVSLSCCPLLSLLCSP